MAIDGKRRLAGWLRAGADRLARGGVGTADGAGPALAPLTMIAGIEGLCAALGRARHRDELVGALPVSQGALAPSFVPEALARVGLLARWQPLSADRLSEAELPALLRCRGGGALLVHLALPGGFCVVEDELGRHTIHGSRLVPLVDDEVLVAGIADPDQIASETEDNDLVRRNPRLWLLGAFAGERRLLGQLALTALLLNLCALSIPLYMRAIYDRVVPNLAIESLWALSAGVMIALVFELLLRHVKSGFVEGIGIRVGQAVQHKAVAAILRGRVRDDENSVGALMTALRDTENLALLVPQAFVTFAVDMPSIVAYFGLIAMIGGWTVLGPVIGACALVTIGFVTNFALKLASRKSSRLVQTRHNLIAEVAEGWQTIKANQGEGRFLTRWDTVSDHIGIATRDVRRWNEMPAHLSGLLVQVVTVLVVMIGVFQIKAGAMTQGAMIAVIMLTSRAMVPVSTAIATVARVYQSLSQIAGLERVLRTEPERRVSDPAIAPGRLDGAIAISGASHRFEGASEDSLRSVSLAIQPGEKVALIGRSGSGKSTLLQLIAGLIPHQQGRIMIDGHAIDQYAAQHLRSSVVYAAQDGDIFDTSIWDNILLGIAEPDEALVERAIRCSGLDAFVSRTVEGYMRKTGPRGSALSGGQRQTVLLARALIRDPQVLLLDEPTASLDITSEAAIINGLREAAEGRTMIVATHRLALLDLVDRVIWLEDGAIVADRPKADVLAMLREANTRRASQAA
ncbi:MAG: ATP-binding cassette domain-containing protein [Sphingomonadales bacterium]|nr:ATP-binding cassette domain-containing protein [Sphingomonadales bacterium]